MHQHQSQLPAPGVPRAGVAVAATASGAEVATEHLLPGLLLVIFLLLL